MKSHTACRVDWLGSHDTAHLHQHKHELTAWAAARIHAQWRARIRAAVDRRVWVSRIAIPAFVQNFARYLLTASVICETESLQTPTFRWFTVLTGRRQCVYSGQVCTADNELEGCASEPMHPQLSLSGLRRNPPDKQQSILPFAYMQPRLWSSSNKCVQAMRGGPT